MRRKGCMLELARRDREDRHISKRRAVEYLKAGDKTYIVIANMTVFSKGTIYALN